MPTINPARTERLRAGGDPAAGEEGTAMLNTPTRQTPTDYEPWALTVNGGSLSPDFHPSIYQIYEKGSQLVANIPVRARRGAHDRSNGRKIAAAPQVLAALIDLRDAVDTVLDTLDDVSLDCPDLIVMRERATEAIMQAHRDLP